MTKGLIVPIGEINQELLTYLKEMLQGQFGISFNISPSQDLLSEAYEPRKRQYYAPTIMEGLPFPPGYARVLGIVDVDLYVPGLNFIFGQADPVSGCALISLIRLRQDFYELSEDENLFRVRVIKEAVHELGHTYGLGHCQDSKCVMFFSNNLSDTDNKGTDFCVKCQGQL